MFRWHARVEFQVLRREFCVVIPDLVPEYFSTLEAALDYVRRNGEFVFRDVYPDSL